MKRIWLGLLAVALATGLCTANDAASGMTKGTPELKSISALAFSPEGVLFIGDPSAATIFAVATEGTKPASLKPVEDAKLSDKIADSLGCTAADLTVNDCKVNPLTGEVYLAVTRQLSGGGPALFKIGQDAKLSEVSLKDVLYASVKLPNPVENARRRTEAITSMAFVDGKLVVAGLSNEEFASTLRTLPFPFKDADKGAAVEIFHAAHNKVETGSPIQTFTTYNISGADYLIASYTCTPLVRVPLVDLKAGSKVKGTTVAELGNRNKPLDIVVYNKDGKDYALMANNSRGVMKITLEGIDKAAALTDGVSGGGTAGTAFETVADLKGVVQLDRFDAEHAVIVVQAADKSFGLKSIALP